MEDSLPSCCVGRGSCLVILKVRYIKIASRMQLEMCPGAGTGTEQEQEQEQGGGTK